MERIETGFNKTEIGKVILGACFVNDLGTVLALGLVFANYNWWPTSTFPHHCAKGRLKGQTEASGPWSNSTARQRSRQ